MIEEYYKLNRAKLLKIAYFITKNIDDAEDAVQDAFVKILRFKSEATDLEKIARIEVVNCSKMILSGRVNKTSKPDPLDLMTVDDQEVIDSIKQPNTLAVEDYINIGGKSSVKEKLLKLVLINGLNILDASMLLDINYNTAKSIYRRFTREVSKNFSTEG